MAFRFDARVTKAERKAIDKYVPTVQDGDLYAALHYVGDDGTKSDIEAALKDLLPEDQFKMVVATFKFAVDYQHKW